MAMRVCRFANRSSPAYTWDSAHSHGCIRGEKMKGYTLERECKVFDDDSGEFVSVTTDADSLDLVEFRQHNKHGNITSRITMMPECAKVFHQAIGEYLSGLVQA